MKSLKNSTLEKYDQIHIIDVSDVLYRNFWTKTDLEYCGKKTGHFKGLCEFCTKLHELFNIEDSKCCAIFVMDAPDGSAQRRAIYPQYKKSEARMKSKKLAPVMTVDNDNFRKIISIFPDTFCVEKSEFEADDLIVYLAKKFCNTHRLFIYARDYDLFFLQKRCKALFKENTTTVINIKVKLKKKYRITDTGMLPYIKILNGDKSDNIPVLFDLRKTKKFIQRWLDEKKVTLYCDELKEQKKGIKRNIKLVMPLKVKGGLEYTDSDSFTSKEKFEVLVNHNLVSFMRYLKANGKKFINIGGLYGKKAKKK